MSRYTAITAKGTEVAWGYDQQLMEYFIHEYEANHGDTIFAISSYSTTKYHPEFPKQTNFPNSQILDLFNRYPEIPQEHKRALGGDLPF